MAKLKRAEVLPSELREGESLEVSWSQEVHIDGDQSWVSYKVFARVQEGETGGQTHKRAMTHMKNGMDAAVHEIVAKARSMGD